MIFKNSSKYKFYLIQSVLLCVLYSCIGQGGDCKKIDLSKDEKGWFSSYKNRDTIYYLSQSNEVDTFVVNAEGILGYTTCNKFELGPYVYQIGALAFDNLDTYAIDDYHKRYTLGFDKTGQDSTDYNSKKSIRFFDLSTSEFYDFSKVPKQEYTIPKKRQKIEVYVYTKNYNCANVEGGTEVMQEFAISKEYGLIWYTTLQGDTYHRIW